MKAVRKGD